MTLSEATVLVVDDEPVLNLTMCLLLERAGARVARAMNGSEALQVIGRQPVDVMVCDQNMPVMDGMTLLRHLEACGQTLPTLLFVSGMDREDMPLLQAMGVCRLLTKPIQPADLIEAVQAALANIPGT